MSKKLEKFVDSYYDHPIYIKVKITGVVPKSRTKLEAIIVDRGPGYNEQKHKYTGVKTKSGWYRGENRDYNKKVQVDYRDLKKVQVDD